MIDHVWLVGRCASFIYISAHCGLVAWKVELDFGGKIGSFGGVVVCYMTKEFPFPSNSWVRLGKCSFREEGRTKEFGNEFL